MLGNILAFFLAKSRKISLPVKTWFKSTMLITVPEWHVNAPLSHSIRLRTNVQKPQQHIETAAGGKLPHADVFWIFVDSLFWSFSLPFCPDHYGKECGDLEHKQIYCVGTVFRGLDSKQRSCAELQPRPETIVRIPDGSFLDFRFQQK